MAELTPKEKTVAYVGVGLWALGCLVGFLIQFYFDFIAVLMGPHAASILVAQFVGAAIALPACFVYMSVPLLIDRFEPEPWWCLAMAWLWGIFGAGGIAMVINTLMGHIGGAVAGEVGEQVMGAVISAPLVEESTKALAVLGMFLFLRRQFDGVVDGFIYASFAGLGFALSENISYYARGLLTDSLGFQVPLRGILRPWNHPFYAAITGIGLGIARETTKSWVKVVAPVGCFLLAGTLHAVWNAHGLVAALLGIGGAGPMVIMILLFFTMMLCLVGIVIYFVVREGRTLRSFLRDEVAMGTLTEDEVRLIVSPFGRLKARFGPGGKTGADFVKAAVRLAMCK
ncbi:MAG: PrsW family intramembrane metalloprotease, partial [Deltaproteobacteria bacterium]|nr:PrsW family intramembrane metalloprotease [Deltaproteobacteria bacterium]